MASVLSKQIALVTRPLFRVALALVPLVLILTACSAAADCPPGSHHVGQGCAWNETALGTPYLATPFDRALTPDPAFTLIARTSAPTLASTPVPSLAPTLAPSTQVPSPTAASAIAGMPQECIYATGCPNAIAGNGTYLGSVTVLSATFRPAIGVIVLTLQQEGVLLSDIHGQGMGGRQGPIRGLLSATNPDIDPALVNLDWALWSGLKLNVFLTGGEMASGAPTYVVTAIWIRSACVLPGFRSAYPTVCR